MLFLLVLFQIFTTLLVFYTIFKLKKIASKDNDLNSFQQRLDVHFETLKQAQSSIQIILENQFQKNREESQTIVLNLQKSVLDQINSHSQIQKNQFDSFHNQLIQINKITEDKLNLVRETLQKQLGLMQDDNNKKLEQMRLTVDEKLHQTLEKRLGESFKLVSDRLEKVHQGLGEMQQLATGVGDLKKVLSNVKTRGVWGEIQLSQLLEQLLVVDQYASQVRTKKGSVDLVDFAIKLPGKLSNDDVVWLPVDAKFPLDLYQYLDEAVELGDKDRILEMKKQLESRVKQEAKSISEKYIDPPHTTDFAILYFPTEGLYAEVLRIAGLQEFLQRQYKVLISGPTTFAALLNSLQMGFRTLAIEKRSSEVWTVLGTVKSEFGKFGDILDKTYKKLQEAGNTIDTAARKSRTIERKLRDVEIIPISNTVQTVIPSSSDQNESLTLNQFSTL